jgi:plastocyanin
MRQFPLRAVLALSVLLAAVACGGGGEAPSGQAAAPSPAAAPAAGGTGSITGTILYTGGDDPDTVIDMAADPNCQALHTEPVYTEKVVADGTGHLAWVFVHIKSGLSGQKYPTPTDKVVLHQQGCTYHPHVFGIMTGQTLVVRNDDETLHNIHALATTNTEFNQGQPFQGMELEHTFDKVEVMLPFKCDVHSWMHADVGVLDNPFYAVTAPDGTYTIKNVPPGTYTVEAWHETFGTRTQEVTVTDGGSADFSFDYAAADAAAPAAGAPAS